MVWDRPRLGPDRDSAREQSGLHCLHACAEREHRGFQETELVAEMGCEHHVSPTQPLAAHKTQQRQTRTSVPCSAGRGQSRGALTPCPAVQVHTSVAATSWMPGVELRHPSRRCYGAAAKGMKAFVVRINRPSGRGDFMALYKTAALRCIYAAHADKTEVLLSKPLRNGRVERNWQSVGTLLQARNTHTASLERWTRSFILVIHSQCTPLSSADPRWLLRPALAIRRQAYLALPRETLLEPAS